MKKIILILLGLLLSSQAIAGTLIDANLCNRLKAISPEAFKKNTDGSESIHLDNLRYKDSELTAVIQNFYKKFGETSTANCDSKQGQFELELSCKYPSKVRPAISFYFESWADEWDEGTEIEMTCYAD